MLSIKRLINSELRESHFIISFLMEIAAEYCTIMLSFTSSSLNHDTVILIVTNKIIQRF